MRIYLISGFLLFLGCAQLSLASERIDLISSLVMPQSEIIYHKKDNLGVHQILLSSPKRINNEIVVEKDLRKSGELNLILTRLPQSERLIDGYNYYKSLLLSQGELLYKCEQRACGVSSYWANDILGDRHLSGRDSNQYYVAGTVHHEGIPYIVSVYLVVNALRQNLAFISVVMAETENTAWQNGQLFPLDETLPPTIRESLVKQLSADKNLILYIASYTKRNQFSSVRDMQNISNLNFLKAQTVLSNTLNINLDRIKHHHVGAFHEQVIDGQNEGWLRLFLFKP